MRLIYSVAFLIGTCSVSYAAAADQPMTMAAAINQMPGLISGYYRLKGYPAPTTVSPYSQFQCLPKAHQKQLKLAIASAVESVGMPVMESSLIRCETVAAALLPQTADATAKTTAG